MGLIKCESCKYILHLSITVLMSKLRNPKKPGYSCHEGGALHPAPRDPRLLPLPELPGVRPPGARVAPPLLRGRQGELWLAEWPQYSPLIGPGLPPPLLHPRPLQPAAAPHRPRVATRGLHHAAGKKKYCMIGKIFCYVIRQVTGPVTLDTANHVLTTTLELAVYWQDFRLIIRLNVQCITHIS